MRVTKIFVGGLPATCEDPDLREYFAQFGTITESVVLFFFYMLILIFFIVLVRRTIYPERNLRG